VKTHALWLSATKNLHFANAPFPRFSAKAKVIVMYEEIEQPLKPLTLRLFKGKYS
jgi:hypothetical protein